MEWRRKKWVVRANLLCGCGCELSLSPLAWEGFATAAQTSGIGQDGCCCCCCGRERNGTLGREEIIVRGWHLIRRLLSLVPPVTAAAEEGGTEQKEDGGVALLACTAGGSAKPKNSAANTRMMLEQLLFGGVPVLGWFPMIRLLGAVAPSYCTVASVVASVVRCG